MKSYCLFSGRHEMPETIGAICSDFNFITFKAVKTEHWSAALEALDNKETVIVYVSGLTPALTEFISDCIQFLNYHGSFILMHYNTHTKEYVKQVVF